MSGPHARLRLRKKKKNAAKMMTTTTMMMSVVVSVRRASALVTFPSPPLAIGGPKCRLSSSSSSSSSSWIERAKTTMMSQQSNDASHHDDVPPPPPPPPLIEQRASILRSNSKLSLAPMMEYTDRHFRHLVRLISSRTLVYSEMVAANAISHASSNFDIGEDPTDPWSSRASLLRFLGQGHRPEGPSVLQLGGSDPRQLYTAAKAVRDLNEVHVRQAAEYDNNQCWRPQQREGGGGGGGGRGGLEGNRDAILGRVYCDYTALNLNCGCPSPKVAGKGCFGAALMSDPILVRELATAMHDGCDGTMPITVKCRIGTDDWMRDHGGFTRDGYHALRSMDEEYGELRKFVEVVAGGGVVENFQLHARIAVLSRDYSPADNRKVPPLRYDHVRRLARDYPELNFSLNGGIETLAEAKRELDSCDGLEGVMIGRGLVADPWSFATADDLLYPPSSNDGGGPKHRMEVLERYGVHADYEEARWGAGKVRRYVLRAVTHLFAGEHNAKRYRIALDEIVASIPKSRRSRGGGGSSIADDGTREGPPLSELILQAATSHLSEEVLYRSPRESYDKSSYEEDRAERKRNVVTTVILGGCGAEDVENNGSNDEHRGGKTLIREWQASRKELELAKDE